MVVVVALILLLCAGGGRAWAVDLEAESLNITIDAKSLSYDQKADSITANGDVVIRRGATELRADRIELDRENNEAHAIGDVVLQDPEGTVTASEMVFNLDSETGAITDGHLYSERLGYSISGKRIEKDIGQCYRIQDGEFTTCHCAEGPPSWSIAGTSLDVELDGYGVLKGGRFKILGTPILYLPRALFPVSTERQSGFLIPRLGVSNRRGFQIIAPFYWAINRSHDVTIGVDVETAARVGLLGDYRYALTPNTGGEISTSYFNEAFDSTTPKNRWSVVAQHDQGVPWDGRGFANVFLVGDDQFLRDINTYSLDYARDVLTRTLRYTSSNAGATFDAERLTAVLEGRYYQDLLGPQSLTLQRVPNVEVFGQKGLFGLAQARLDATGTLFQREQGIDGLRADFSPGVGINIPTGLPVRTGLDVTLRGTGYALTERRMRGGLDPDSSASWVLELPGEVSRATTELRAEAGTSISRVYSVGGDQLLRLRHTIEPIISYLYVPQIAQDDLPVFDENDRINQRNLITYGAVSRLFGKFSEPANDPAAPPTQTVRELGSVSLFQSYDTVRTIAPVGEPPGGDRGDHLSDIDLVVRANPLPAASILARTNYDTSQNDISAAAVALRLSDPREKPKSRLGFERRSTVTLGYRFITQNILQQVDGSFLLYLTDYVAGLYTARYDVLNSRLLETHFGLRLLSSCDCWGVDLAFTDKSNPNELEFRAQVTLVGIGSSGSSSGLP